MGDFKEFLVSEILPAREISLVGGPSGAGKTRLVLQAIPVFLEGGEWLGKPIPIPFKIFYLSCDRSADSFRRNLDFYGIPEDRFPWTTLSEVKSTTMYKNIQISSRALPNVLGWIRENHPSTSLVIIDGFTSMIPDGKINDYRVVSDFLTDTQRTLHRLNLTLLGLVHTSKIKESEMILNPRQKIAGSVAWAGYSDLIVIINPEDDRNPDNQNRVVHVLPRNSAEYTIPMRMVEGRLEPVDLQGILESAESIIEEGHSGDQYTTSSLRLLAEGVPHATFERWLKEKVGEGLLVRTGRGRYERC